MIRLSHCLLVFRAIEFLLSTTFSFTTFELHPRNASSPSTTQSPATQTMSFNTQDFSDPQTASRRRRIEIPSMNDDVLKIFKIVASNPTEQAKAAAMCLLDEEFAKCDADDGIPSHVAIHFVHLHLNRYSPREEEQEIGELLHALYYRARVQSTILDIFVLLNQHGFIDLESLWKPVAINETSEDSKVVLSLLSTFEAVVIEENMVAPAHPLWEVDSTKDALQWLATMIVRGCNSADITKLFKTIEKSGFLGPVNEHALEMHKSYVRDGLIKGHFSCNPNKLEDRENSTSNFGF